jgi:hypothetical protein
MPLVSGEQKIVGADHRKPVAAFVVLAFIAAALVGMQRADAHGGRFLASAVGVVERIERALPHPGPPTSAGDDDPLAARTGGFDALSHAADAAHRRSRSGDAKDRGRRAAVERRGAPDPMRDSSAHPAHPVVKVGTPGPPERGPRSTVGRALARSERRARQLLEEGSQALRRPVTEQKAVEQAEKTTGRAGQLVSGLGLSD